MPDLDWTGYKNEALRTRDEEPDPLDELRSSLSEEIKNSDLQYDEKIIDFLLNNKDDRLQDLVKDAVNGSWYSELRLLDAACLLHLWEQRKG